VWQCRYRVNRRWHLDVGLMQAVDSPDPWLKPSVDTR